MDQTDDLTTPLDVVEALVEQALADDMNPAQLSYALIAVATRMGLDLAPDAGQALALVMKASSDVAIAWVSEKRAGEFQQPECASAPSVSIH
jgi:hypothetical protein